MIPPALLICWNTWTSGFTFFALTRENSTPLEESPFASDRACITVIVVLLATPKSPALGPSLMVLLPRPPVETTKPSSATSAAVLAPPSEVVVA